MSKKKVNEITCYLLPATCYLRLGEGTKSGPHQSSARLGSSKAGTVSLADVGEAGPPWCGIEDEPAWGHCDFQCPGCRQIGHVLIGS